MKKKAIERLSVYLEYKELKPAVFERLAGISNGYISKALSRNADIGESILLQVLDYCPDLNPEWFVFGRGEMIVSDNSLSKGHAKANLPPVEKGVPLIPFSAFAGSGLKTFDDLTIEHYYIIPEFKNADFIIRVKGNSMFPKYSSGDLVACRIVSETLFFQWNSIYAIHTRSQGVFIKRVKKSQKPEHILLVSDNVDYEPFDVPLSDILTTAKVLGAIILE